MNLHPDIQQGMLEGVQAFRDGIFFPEDDKRWTEDDIIQLVEKELSGPRYKRENRYEELTGKTPLPYLHHIGFVLGYINEALAASYVAA